MKLGGLAGRMSALQGRTAGRRPSRGSSQRPPGPDAGSVREGARGDAERDVPSLPSMVRIVAISVALIILVSFAAGYAFGRFFL